LRQDLIDVVSLEAGRLAVYLEEQPLEPIVSEAIETLGDLAHGKDLRISSSFPEDLPGVRADRQRLLQVLSNLIGNAVKFTPAGGEIIFRIETEEGFVRVSVEDTGPGIAAESIDRVFDPFWRGQRGHRGGAGLGLAIAKGIVLTHGGRIWVESEIGRGSAFRFTLPRSSS
jgi:signal transduction histidine kinase